MWKWNIVDVDGKKVWRRVEEPVVAPPAVVVMERQGRQATGDRRAAPVYPAQSEV